VTRARREWNLDEIVAHPSLPLHLYPLSLPQQGKLDNSDLKEVLERLGYKDVEDSVIKGIVNEVDFSKAGALHFENFLDVVSAIKDVQLDSAFTHILNEVGDGSKIRDPVGSKAKEQSKQREQSRTIPVEKAGGGW